MQELFQILGFFALAAAVAFAASLWLATRNTRWKQAWITPGSPVRLKTGDAVYRCRFAGTRRDGLALEAPIQRDHYVPISVGERVTVEAFSERGVFLFRTKVAGRDAATHELLLDRPDRIHREDRRADPRIHPRGSAIRVEEQPAWLADLGPLGLAFTSDRALKSGERIKVDLDGEESRFAWVLESGANGQPGRGRFRTRARFETRASI